MTIKILGQWGDIPANSIITLDTVTENALIASGQATATLTGGVVWTPPGNSQPAWPSSLNLMSSPVLVSQAIVITPANQHVYNGATLEFTAAATLTLSAGLRDGFALSCIPPVSGNVTVASAGGTLLNGGTGSLTRAAAQNAVFAILKRASVTDSYLVTGA